MTWGKPRWEWWRNRCLWRIWGLGLTVSWDFELMRPCSLHLMLGPYVLEGSIVYPWNDATSPDSGNTGP